MKSVLSRAAHLAKTKIALVLAVALIAVPAGALLLDNTSKEESRQTNVHGVQGKGASSTTDSNQTIEVTSESSQTVNGVTTEQSDGYVSYQGQDGKTALEILKSVAEVETETSEFGELVTSINGVDGSGEKYWIFYVDGDMASVGAGDYQTKDGEKIEWKLQ